jgi:hypothetical protein
VDLDKAIQAHGEWKAKFRSTMQKKQQLDAAAIAKSNACPLGQWLHGDAKARYGSLASYKSCVEKHAAFHAEAGKVGNAITAGSTRKPSRCWRMGPRTRRPRTLSLRRSRHCARKQTYSLTTFRRRRRRRAHLRQNTPVHSTSSGKISSRPRIIASVHTQLWKSLKLA